MKTILHWLRSVAAAFALSLPEFSYGKSETDDEPLNYGVEQNKTKPGGTLSAAAWSEQVREGVTIAGGPGSGSTYTAFDALPEATRREWIEARKGKIRPERPADDSEETYEWRPATMQAMADAIRRRKEEKYKLTPKGMQPK